MTAPTQEDVARLVTTAEVVLGFHGPGGLHRGYELDAALIPFRPDPDDELIDAMAWSYCEGVGGTTQSIKEVSKGIRAALATYRRHTEVK